MNYPENILEIAEKFRNDLIDAKPYTVVYVPPILNKKKYRILHNFCSFSANLERRRSLNLNYSSDSSAHTKPPLGLVSRELHSIRRLNEVSKAIRRCYLSNLPIPVEWIEEYNELVQKCIKG